MIVIKTDEIIKQEEDNKKVASEVMKLYGEFLNAYDSLNTKFSLNNPVEIFTMFYQLFSHGYLSIDKKFEHGDDLSVDDYVKFGLSNSCSIFLGSGVCRQTSKMLVDILKKRKISSYQLTTECYSFIYEYSLETEPITTEEELFHWIQTRMRGDESTQERLLAILVNLDSYARERTKLARTLVVEKDPMNKIFGNHEICIAKQGKKVYYLDPINNMIYRRDHNRLINYDIDCTIRRIGTLFPSGINKLSLKEYLDILRLLLIRQTSSEVESEDMQLRTEILFRENIDSFESFYNANKELYGDIKNKISQLQRIRYKKNTN